MSQRNFNITSDADTVGLADEFERARHFQPHHYTAIAFLVLGGILVALFNVMTLFTAPVSAPEEPQDQLSDSTEVFYPCEKDCTPDELPTPDDTPEAPPEAPTVPAPNPAPPVTLPEESSGEKLVALTFDDGPSAYQTPRLLNMLEAESVPVTFFVLGNLTAANPALVARASAAGHEIASHSYRHTQLTTLSVANLQADLSSTVAAIESATGVAPALLRPPYGSYNRTVQSVAGVPLILWSVDPQDWKYRDSATVYANVVNATRDGSIILLHDIHATTVDAVPRIIATLKARGYTFLTVSQLLAVRGITPQPGRVYTSAP
jgi:peptidoglycan/xylan/chitin deacetylase (PgdA/CDA1 family)